MGSREYLTISNIVFTWIECYLYAIILVILKLSLSWEGKSLTIIKRIYEINWILNIIRVDSRRYDVKKNYQRQIGHVHNSFMEKAKRQYAQKVIAQWHFTLKRGCYGFVNSTTTSICCLIISNVKFDIK